MTAANHPLECTCHRCFAPLAAQLASQARAQRRELAARAIADRKAAATQAKAELELRISRAVEQAAMRYEIARGRIGLRTAAKRASLVYGVSEHSVLSRLQRTHGQGNKRGKPKRHQSAARRAA